MTRRRRLTGTVFALPIRRRRHRCSTPFPVETIIRTRRDAVSRRQGWTRSVKQLLVPPAPIGLEHIGFALLRWAMSSRSFTSTRPDVSGGRVEVPDPLDRAQSSGTDKHPNSKGTDPTAAWDPRSVWDMAVQPPWPSFKRHTQRWSHNAPMPRPSSQSGKPSPIRRSGQIQWRRRAPARDWVLWTTGVQKRYTNVYAGTTEGEPSTLVKGSQHPSDVRTSKMAGGKRPSTSSDSRATTSPHRTTRA